MDAKRLKLYASFFLISLDETTDNEAVEKRCGMWFVTTNIDSHSIEWVLTMFVNIRVLRLRSMDWKSSLSAPLRVGVHHLIIKTSSFSQTSVFKMFSVNTETQRRRFQISPV